MPILVRLLVLLCVLTSSGALLSATPPFPGPRVYAPGRYTVKAGRDKPDGRTVTGLEPVEGDAKAVEVKLD